MKIASSSAARQAPDPTKPRLLTLVVKSKAALFAAYVRSFSAGGLFIPSTDSFAIGQEVLVVVSLPELSARHTFAARVAWITPVGAYAHRRQGVAVTLPTDEAGQALKRQIEAHLGRHLDSDRPTQTI